MKKFLILFLVLLLTIVFVGCNKSTETPSELTSNSETLSQPQISSAVITDALLSFRYPAGAFSIPLKNLLPECCPDYKATFATYEELKSQKLTEEQIQKYETSNIKEYLGNSYFVTVTGCIMENPDIPYLVTENKEILTLLIIFDNNDAVVGHIIINNCSQLDTCAILIATNY